jgi:hypothetical protein
MEEVTLTRHLISNLGIIGYLHYKNKRVATTLENKWHHNIPNISCIPEGEYICKEDNTGKFQWWTVEGVVARENIEIHQGNKVDDTLGCIIVGKLGSETIDHGRLWVSQSRATLKELKKILPKEFKLIVE